MGRSVIEGLEPTTVLHWFEKLCEIPHGSGNEKEISDFLVSFAKERKLEVVQDEAYNVVIRKEGTEGYENSPTVVIQGHMDMVCEKTPESAHDFSKDPIRLCVDGDFLYAENTTLGGDNGIAVAMGMAVVAADDIPHPPIELLLTTSEETGMDGAHALDPKLITGRKLINIDSEEEGILTVSCAGGCNAHINFPISRVDVTEGKKVVEVSVKGLRGGHSGIEIVKGLGNADKLLARTLNSVSIPYALCAFDGGNKHNAIPREAKAILAIDAVDEAKLKEETAQLEKTLRVEYQVADPDVQVAVCDATVTFDKAFEETQAKNLLEFLDLVPDGMQTMSASMPGLVESSLNMGVVETKDNCVDIVISIRSSVGSLKENIFRRITRLAAMTGGEVERASEYPEWSYNPDSELRDVFVSTFEDVYGHKPEVTAIHAGLECALFAEKFCGEMDMISMGPDMSGVHTVQEKMSISSVERTWKYLLEVLKNLK